MKKNRLKLNYKLRLLQPINSIKWKWSRMKRYEDSKLYILISIISKNTVKPRCNEGPRDWQNLFALSRIHHIEVLFHTFYNYRGKENRSLYRGLHYREVRYMEFQLNIKLSNQWNLKRWRNAEILREKVTKTTLIPKCKN